MPSMMLTLLDRTTANRFHREGYWREETFYDIVRAWSMRAPDKIAFQEAERQLTYRQLIDAADRVAAWLEGNGVRAGQRVAYWASSRAETAAVLLACSRQRFVCCPSLHRDHTVQQVTDLIGRMRASALIAEPGYGANGMDTDIFAAVGDLPDLRVVVPITAREGNDLFLDLPTMPEVPPGPSEPDTVLYLAFTSGSTGLPKGVMHSDNTVLTPVRALASDWSFDSESVVYSLSPLSHNLGFGALVLALTIGGRFVAHDPPRGTELLQRLIETRATFLFGVPTHAFDLVEELDRHPDIAHDVRGFRVSGAAMSPSIARRLLQHGITPQSGYGMTEAGSHHYTRPDDDAELVVHTSGRPYAGYEVRVTRLDDIGVDVAPGESGQILARGPGLMLGYFDDQQHTEESFTPEGWFITGDLGVMGEHGYLRITGRKKDLIIRGGRNIYPAEIESLTMRHPWVDLAAAIPVADDRLGEKVCVVIRTGTDAIDPAEILEHLAKEGLSRYNMPEYLLTLSQVPLLASGKVDKRRLVDLISRGDLVPQPVRYEGSPTAMR